MSPLRALLTFLGLFNVGGHAYAFLTPSPGVTRGQLADAGYLAVTDPTLMDCQVRIADACRSLPDGGTRSKYATLRLQGGLETRTTPDAIVFHPCYEPVDFTACTFVEADAGCTTDNTICGDATQLTVKLVQDRCACRDPSQGLCRITNPLDGGLIQAPLGATVEAPFVGAGCVRKPCAEVAGDQGQSWPAACPR